MPNADALKARFAGVYDAAPARRTTPPLAAGMALPGGTFRSVLADVKTVVVHETSGFPARNRQLEFVERYIVPGHEKRGFGPQFYVSSDGTVAQLVGDGRETWHATFLNRQALGIENGHREDRSGVTNSAGVVLEAWRALSADAEDVQGQKLFVFRHRFDNPHEVVFCWFPTASFAGPKGSAVAETGMLFTEFQYRSLSALVRFLAEQSLVPRNFPLLPWATREHDMDNPADPGASPRFRMIVLADERFSPVVVELTALGFTEPMFDRANLVAFRTQYHHAIAAENTIAAIPAFLLGANANKRLNHAWLNLFKAFRGIHGHGFAGAITHHDDHTTCPGVLFDWHRFAREVWDWWWYPFDFDDAFAAPATALRNYFLSPGLDTPLVEHFFENAPTDGRPDPYLARTRPPAGPPSGLFGAQSSPATFRLEPTTPIYAMANGELVAARLLPATAGVSLSFALVRHEVYHLPDLLAFAAIVGGLGVALPPHWPKPGRIDYNTDPATVYSLYMHLGAIDQMDFDQVVPNNPEWLNRVLIRKKECDLAIDAAGNLNAVLQAMPVADFSRPAPPSANRPTSIELLRLDKERLGVFLDDLRTGAIATAPIKRPVLDNFGPTPIKVVLGDFLGLAGIIRVAGGVTMHGIGIEVFARDLIRPTFFTDVQGKTSWDPPAGVAHPAIQYQSEWSRTPNAAARTALQAIGANPDLVEWWSTAAGHQLWDMQLAASVKLPWDGVVYHYDPLDFIRWINDLTWTSEWPKYQMVAGGADMPRPPRPRPRRVV